VGRIPAPDDFHPNIVQGKTYDLTSGIGKSLWEQVEIRLRSVPPMLPTKEAAEEHPKYGTPIKRKWGQAIIIKY
jgi:hypothetical protein